MAEASNTIISYPAAGAGTMTRALEAGNGSEAVLFLHGVGARADRWRQNLGVIASAGYRCIAIDLPGHGFAKKGPGFAYGVPGYADFVGAFLKEQGIGRAHFVGTSLGAHILGTLITRSPGIALSFTMIGATGMFPIGSDTRENIANRIVDSTRDGIQRKLTNVVYDPGLVTERWVDEEWKINNSPGAADSFAALADYFRQNLDRDIVGEKLASTTGAQRRLLVWGEEDRSVPLAIGRKVADLLGLSLHAIPKTAHAPYWEAPKEFNALLLSFLKSIPSA